MNTIEIAIRSIQHYMYCPHRWGLLEIDKAWEENVFVTKANLIHGRVHDSNQSYVARGKKVYTAVPVFNDLEQYNLYGLIDCLELTPDEGGVSVNGSEDRYNLCIVEYKPTHPKSLEYREDDFMQVFAQKICVDYVFGGDCDGVLYYADVKKRITLPLRKYFDEYDEKLKNILEEMRLNLRDGKIPAIRKNQNCSGCSMKNVCLPFLSPYNSLRAEIEMIERSAQ